MIKQIIYFFHIVIITLFIGCGYKADPSWKPKKHNINTNDLKIIDINSSMKVKL